MNDPKKPAEIEPESKKELDFEDEFEECDEWNDYDYDLIEYEE